MTKTLRPLLSELPFVLSCLEGISEDAGTSASDEKRILKLLYGVMCQQNTAISTVGTVKALTRKNLLSFDADSAKVRESSDTKALAACWFQHAANALFMSLAIPMSLRWRTCQTMYICGNLTESAFPFWRRADITLSSIHVA